MLTVFISKTSVRRIEETDAVAFKTTHVATMQSFNNYLAISVPLSQFTQQTLQYDFMNIHVYHVIF